MSPAEIAVNDVFPKDIDFNQPGRRHWRVRIDAKDSAGKSVTINIPIVVWNGNQPGPTLLLTGGVHGDEYTGPMTLMTLAAEPEFAIDAGRLIMVPNINPEATRNHARKSPQDDLDLNRSFPGDADGTITQVVAAFMADVLTPKADYVVDLHAAGLGGEYIPCTMIHFLDDEDKIRESFDIATAFNAPVTFVYDEPVEGLFDTYVEEKGIPFICVELGGHGRVTKELLDITRSGVIGVLQKLGLIAHGASAPFSQWNGWSAPRVVTITNDHSLPKAPIDGLVELKVEVGDVVQKGDVVAYFRDVDAPWDLPHAIKAEFDGIVIAADSGGYFPKGEEIIMIAEDITCDDQFKRILELSRAYRNTTT